MNAEPEGQGSSFDLRILFNLPDHELHAGRRILTGVVALHVVLDDAFEVIGHQVLQGTFVGQTEAVGENDGRVDDRAVDELEREEVALQTVSDEDGLRPEHAEQHSLNVPQSDGGVR